MEIENEIKEKIYDYLRENKFGEGYIWQFQNWTILKNDLNPHLQKEFINVINKMMDEQYLIPCDNKNYPDFKITKKLEDEIYN